MAKRTEVTSPRVASTASELLSSPKSSPAVKSVAASALTQATSRPVTKKK